MMNGRHVAFNSSFIIPPSSFKGFPATSQKRTFKGFVSEMPPEIAARVWYSM
jgi:hypothetical protein